MLHFYVSEHCASEKQVCSISGEHSFHCSEELLTEVCTATRKILLRDTSDFWIKTSAGVITVVVRKYISG